VCGARRKNKKNIMCRVKDAIIDGTYYQSKAVRDFPPVVQKVQLKPIRDEGMQYDEMVDNRMTLDWY